MNTRVLSATRAPRSSAVLAVFLGVASFASAATLAHRYELNGNLNDSIGSRHATGTGAGEASAPVSYDAGRPAGASGPIASVRLGHVEDAVTGFTIPGETLADSGSVSFWFKPDRANAGEGADWVLNAGGTYNKDFRVGVAANGTLLEANVAKTNGGLTRIRENTWYHVVITWDKTAGTAKLYLDGVLSKSREWSEPDVFAPGPVRIGNWSFSPRYVTNQFSGLIYDIQIYSGQLEPAQVKQLHAAPGSALSR